MIELDILIEEIELSNMSRVGKKYIYENLLDIRQKLTEQLRISDVGSSFLTKAVAKAYNKGLVDGVKLNEPH